MELRKDLPRTKYKISAPNVSSRFSIQLSLSDMEVLEQKKEAEILRSRDADSAQSGLLTARGNSTQTDIACLPRGRIATVRAMTDTRPAPMSSLPDPTPTATGTLPAPAPSRTEGTPPQTRVASEWSNNIAAQPTIKRTQIHLGSSREAK